MNKRILMHSFFIVTTLAFFCTKSFAEPQNIGLLRKELRKYHDTGAYDKEVMKVVKEADAFIASRVKANKASEKPAKLAIVLDIDDTSLATYKDVESRDFCVNQKNIKRAVQRGKFPPIAPIHSLYEKARSEGVAIFFITGRSLDVEQATYRNLKNAGFKTWSGIYFRPKSDNSTSVVPYKSQVRSIIATRGYTIIASIGDQESDLLGGYAEKTFKLPNPYYYLP